MLKHWKYLKYVLRHKWFVLLACLEYGLIWRGVVHDLSKFMPSEWFPYVEYFYGEKLLIPNCWTVGFDGIKKPCMEQPDHVKQAFDFAWLHHQKNNTHHWQYWLLSPDNPRPNFSHQSFDGGMSHGYIRTVDGAYDVAIIYEASIAEWWKEPPVEIQRQLERDLDNTPVPLEMPMADRKEMIADWRGAGKALGKPKTWEWYNANKEHIFLAPGTRVWVEGELDKLRRRHEFTLERLKKDNGTGVY